MAAAISKPLLSDLVAQTAGQRPSSHPIRPVGDRPDLANVDDNESGSGIPLIDLMELNGPERRKVVAAISRACESDGFFMVTNHGVPAPAGVVEGMLRVDGELFHFHLPESERLKCGYSDDPNKAAEARALLEALSESLGLELERSHMGRHAQPHMAVNYYPPCPQPDLITYGLPVHKDPHAIITQLLQDQQDGVSGLQVQRGSRWVAANPVPNALVINIGDQMQAIGLSTSFNVRPHRYPLESFVDQWPSNPPSFRLVAVGTYATEARARLLEAMSECVGYSSSNLPYCSSRAACNVWGDNIHRAIQRCVRKLGCSSPSYCLPITVSSPSFPDAAPQPGQPHGSETESPFSPVFILQKNNVKVEVITNEATSNEDVSKFDLATIAGTLSLLVPMAINIDELTTSWGLLGKVLCGIFMIMSLILALIGLFTASFREGSRARNLSSHCARLSLLGATIVFVLLIASKLGCVGCAAGVALVLVMLALTVLWIRSEEPTGRAAHEV